MAKFVENQFFNVCKDIDGVELTYDIPPTQEEIDAAIKAGLQSIVPKKAPLTIQHAIKTVLRTDMSEQNGHGRVPDPHQDKKYEIFVLLGKIANMKESELGVVLEAEEITIIKERAKKYFSVEAYGFIYNFLEGKN